MFSRLPGKCKQVDQPIAALIKDLKERGLLDETLVVWSAEFGRTPMGQGTGGSGEKTSIGRDHHKEALPYGWRAGEPSRGMFMEGRMIWDMVSPILPFMSTTLMPHFYIFWEWITNA